jgi:hypothetical protein
MIRSTDVAIDGFLVNRGLVVVIRSLSDCHEAEGTTRFFVVAERGFRGRDRDIASPTAELGCAIF